MRDHGVGRDQVAVFVEVGSPRIHHAFRNFFEHMSHRMKPPQTACDLHALVSRCARFADERVRRQTDGSIQPTVWSPMKIVEHVVGRNLKAIQHHLRGGIRLIVSVAIRDERKFRRVGDPHSAVPHGQSGQVSSLVVEDLSFVELSVVVRVFENNDAICAVTFFPLRVRIVFHHPQSPAIIEVECNRSPDVRFARKQRHGKTVRHSHACQ